MKLAKMKKRPAKMMRHTIRRQQKYIFANRGTLGGELNCEYQSAYLRSAVRDKAKAPVEFGVKYDVSIDKASHARLEKISVDPYNEGSIFRDMQERYKAYTRHYSGKVLADQIYWIWGNWEYCKEYGIRMPGPNLKRPFGDYKTGTQQ